LIEPAHREVLAEYLLALGRRPAPSEAVLQKWLTDAHVSEIVKSGRWEPWTDGIRSEQVTTRAQQLGWKWFATIGKK
jgi:hypothetical protein